MKKCKPQKEYKVQCVVKIEENISATSKKEVIEILNDVYGVGNYLLTRTKEVK